MKKEKKVHTPLQTNNALLNKAFIILSAVCMLLSIELAIISRGVSIQDTLFWNGAYSDHFMDFFNTLRDSHDLTWVYQRNTIYPPLSVLMMYMFASMVPEELSASTFADRYIFQQSQIAVILFFMIAFVCILFLAKMISAYMQRAGVGYTRYFVIFFLTISFPLLYCVERGNTSLISLMGCAFFLFFRNSENKVVREISYLALAFAAGLKMFPAVLGVLLLYDRNIKAAVRTVIYGVLVFALPFVIVKLITPETGIADQVAMEIAAGTRAPTVDSDGSALRFVQNLLNWFNKRTSFNFNSTSIANLFYLLNNFDLIKASAASALSMIAFVLTEIIAFVAGFFCKKEWQKLFCACYLMLNIHAIAMHYTLIYVLPVFVAFLCEKTAEKVRSKLDWLYFAAFSILIVPIPYLLYSVKNSIYIFFAFNLNLAVPNQINQAFSCAAFQLIFIVLMFELISQAVNEKKRKKEVAASKQPEAAAIPA